MNWIVLSILTALFSAFKDIWSKYLFKSSKDVLVQAFFLSAIPAPIFGVVAYYNGIPKIGNHFILALILGSTLNILAVTSYLKAVKESDVSLVVPLVALSPIFMLITSPLILGEIPDKYGAIGIFLIVLGTYMLNLKKKMGFFYPFLALWHDSGARYMLLTAFIWSISANFDKMGIINSSPVFWAFSIELAISVLIFLIMISKINYHKNEIKNNFCALSILGIFHGAMIFFQMFAVSMTLVAYVIAIKRVSVLIVVISGYLFFKESGIKKRLLGSILMILGFIIITIFK
jgi:uncharacterized membrane protein